MLKLREFVRQIRNCKTAEEERSLANKESAEIRNLSKEQAEANKIRNLSKCVFMTLLGYHTEFIQMPCLGLLASTNFTEKRLAYVGICVFLDENSEVLLLTSHTIKKDLESPNQFIVASALNAIGELCTADMCRDSASNVLKCLGSSNPYIKKKAALALTKIISKCPELVDTVADKLNLVFEDKNHGVLLCGLCLANLIFKTDERYITKNKKYLPSIIKYLKSLSTANYAPEFDINNITDPFLQVKLLEVLSHFGKVTESGELNDLLASISTNTDSSKNTGNAVLYELVRTILAINSDSSLKVLASNILGKFLSGKDNNYKYIALNCLQEVAKTDLNSVQRHKAIILECLKDLDLSIKRRSLDLIYIIINSSTIKQIVNECLNFLLSGENEFKLELTTKIAQSLAKYSPSLKWEIDVLIKMLCLAGNHISQETLHSITNLIIDSTELQTYSMFKLFIAMKSNLGQDGLINVGIYALGELFPLIINHSVTTEDETISITEEDVIMLIDEVNARKCSCELRERLVNCYFKIITKCSEKLGAHLAELLELETRNFNCEIQQRASEYLLFLSKATPELKQEIVGKIPTCKNEKESVIEKKVFVEEFEGDDDPGFTQLIGGTTVNAKSIKTEDALSENANKAQGGILQDIEAIFMGSTSSANAPIGKGADDNLFDLFSGSGGSNIITNQDNIQHMTSSTSTGGQGLGTSQPMDFLSQLNQYYTNPKSNPNPSPGLGLGTGSFPNQMPIQSENQAFSNVLSQATPLNSFGNNSNIPLSQPTKKPLTSTTTQSAMKEIYNDKNLSLYFNMNPNTNPPLASIFASSNTSSPISNVKINLGVKKYITLKVISTSGSYLSPNQSLGIKKEITIVNNEPDKEIVIKFTLSYSIDGIEVPVTFIYTQ